MQGDVTIILQSTVWELELPVLMTYQGHIYEEAKGVY